jgi:transcriptional regulator with XRE-family HTH domain
LDYSHSAPHSFYYFSQKQEVGLMKLKEIRNKNNFSIRELSELSNVPKRTIEDIERKGECKVSTAIKLADALKVTLDELCR